MSDKPTTLPQRLSDRVGKLHVPTAKRQRVQIRARYDNAEDTDINERYWAYATSGSPDSLASKWVRDKLTQRCRYECRNNSWAKGIRDTLANDTIGTGPRLQMLIEGDKALNTLIEAEFWAWANEIGLAQKLRTMRAARVDSGETFGLCATNPRLMSDVKLDISFVEPEQVTDPYVPAQDANTVDGIEYDAYGNPIFYTVLKDHPNGNLLSIMPSDYDRWPARFVLHYFRPDRPGMRRGVPDLSPAIDQFAELRRYCKAVIGAAEAMADHALVLTTNSEDNVTDDSGETGQETLEAMDKVEIGRWLGVTLPKGYTLGQPESKQPIDTYKDFVNAKLAEIARCLNVPFYIAGLDAAGANMSAAYVVGQKYERTIAVDRSEIERLLDRLLDLWLTEWVFINRGRGTELPEAFKHVWQWDEIGNHADPAKVANAAQTELAAGTTNIPREYAKKGLDWEDEQEQDAKSLGMTIQEYRAALREKRFGTAKAQAAQPKQEQPENENEPEGAKESEA